MSSSAAKSRSKASKRSAAAAAANGDDSSARRLPPAVAAPPAKKAKTDLRKILVVGDRHELGAVVGADGAKMHPLSPFNPSIRLTALQAAIDVAPWDTYDFGDSTPPACTKYSPKELLMSAARIGVPAEPTSNQGIVEHWLKGGYAACNASVTAASDVFDRNVFEELLATDQGTKAAFLVLAISEATVTIPPCAFHSCTYALQFSANGSTPAEAAAWRATKITLTDTKTDTEVAVETITKLAYLITTPPSTADIAKLKSYTAKALAKLDGPQRLKAIKTDALKFIAANAARAEHTEQGRSFIDTLQRLPQSCDFHTGKISATFMSSMSEKDRAIRVLFGDDLTQLDTTEIRTMCAAFADMLQHIALMNEKRRSATTGGSAKCSDDTATCNMLDDLVEAMNSTDVVRDPEGDTDGVLLRGLKRILEKNDWRSALFASKDAPDPHKLRVHPPAKTEDHVNSKVDLQVASFGAGMRSAVLLSESGQKWYDPKASAEEIKRVVWQHRNLAPGAHTFSKVPATLPLRLFITGLFEYVPHHFC